MSLDYISPEYFFYKLKKDNSIVQIRIKAKTQKKAENKMDRLDPDWRSYQ